ncbi:MAG: membrane integrity-associated transporter subunit PqiC [Bauldia sp.]|nr:membrane integrity-associated transporter subunit PqiC [Bauldia sp.]
MVLHDRWRRALRLGGVLAATALLAGCEVFAGPPPETFNLAAPVAVSQSGASTSAQILIPLPSAIATLDTAGIVVMEGPRYAYYPESQWPDKLPVVVQARLMEAFEKSGRVRAVGRPGEGLSIDYALLIDIRAFEFEAPAFEAEVELAVRVMNDRNGSILGTRTFTARAPVASDSPDGVVAALSEAFDQVVIELVDWSLARI